MKVQKLVEDLDHATAQALDRCEFTNVHTGQLFRQGGLVAVGEAPVGEVVRKSLADEVMLLQSAKGVLKDGIFRAGLQGMQ